MAARSPVAAALARWRKNLLNGRKQAIHRDLELNEARLTAHPVVRALAGEGLRQPAEAAERPTTYPILEADSSQRACLEAASRGESFVLQGPPGCGKTQTLVNLIADRLADGKTVLIVSESSAVLEGIHKPLCEAGLGDFCLDLHGPETDPRELLGELTRCLQSMPQHPQEEPREHGTQLQAWLAALHQRREPLRQSAWWALEELTRCTGLPDVPLGLAEPADLTPDWFGQAQGAMQRLQQLWYIPEQGPDFPWWGFKIEGRFTQKLREEVIALLDRIRRRIDRLTSAGQEYGSKIGATGPAAWLLRLADALDANPRPPGSWLRAADLSEISADLERCAADSQQGGQAREPLTARYGSNVWHLPDGTRGQVESSWRAVAPLLAPGDDRGAGLLTRQQQLRGWAADTQRRLPGWISDAHVLEKWLGITLPRGLGADGKDDPSVQSLKKLHRLANLCVAENAPERSWTVDAAALENARKLIVSHRPLMGDFNKRRAGLLERYTEQIFELDLDGFARRLDGPYRSWLRMFNLQFRRERRALGRRCRTENLPGSWGQDVAEGGALARQKAALDADQPARQAVLGRYEKGVATDFEAAERATRIAAEAVELARELNCPTLPGRLLDALTATSPPAEKVRAALKRLHDSLGAWQHATEELQAHLPLANLPGPGVPLEAAALSSLASYAQDLQGRLNAFAVAADPVLAHAEEPPADAVSLVSDLRQVEELRSLEQTQKEDDARWSARLGPAFKGAATDWKALRKALGWTTRVRELFKPAVVPEAFVAAATDSAAAPSARDLRQARDQLDQALHALDNRFEPAGQSAEGVSPPKRYVDLPLEELPTRIETLRRRVGELADWVEWRHMAERFGQLGLTAFWEGLQKVRPPHGRLADVFTRAVLGNWLEGIFQQDPVLSEFCGKDHEQMVAELHDLDQRLLRLNARRAVQLLARRKAQVSDAERTWLQSQTEQDDLPAVRSSLEQAADLVLKLKPCLFLSPETVSGFLPAEKLTADLAVFDDAACLAVEDALGAIYRVRQVVVAGHSFPPAAGNEAPGENLLDACLAAGLPPYTLANLYRTGEEEEAESEREETAASPGKN